MPAPLLSTVAPAPAPVLRPVHYRRCSRCLMDTTVPGITFDASGECNFCAVHDSMERAFPLGEAGRRAVARHAEAMRRAGRGHRYDCVVGVSGGRDSSYTLWYCATQLRLRVLAVYFNDGFGNPVAGENMVRACHRLGVDLRTVTSDWRESKDLKIAFLKASVPDMEEGTDLGIATALYGVAAQEGLRHVVIGQSFRTEGIAPLSWNYLDGRYLKAVHRQFGTVPLRRWRPTDPGFNLGLKEMVYYTFVRRIRTVTPLYHLDYVRTEVDELLARELGWVSPGAHYADDLYQSVIYYLNRIKFNIDRRLFNYSALLRSGQMSREVALDRVSRVNPIDDEKVVALCIKRLGLTRAEFDAIVAAPPRTFRDYPTSYGLLWRLRGPIKLMSRLNLLPESAYDKYFRCGT